MLLWFGGLLVVNWTYNTLGFKRLPVVDLLNQLGYLLTFLLASWLCSVPQLNVPALAFSGLFAPYWMDDARGTICEFLSSIFSHIISPSWFPSYFRLTFSLTVGITAYTKKGHIARATLEATCFQTKAILDAMEKDSGHALAELAVDGGMTNSDLCMQVCLPFPFPLFPFSPSPSSPPSLSPSKPIQRPSNLTPVPQRPKQT